MRHAAILIALLSLLAGCATQSTITPIALDLEPGRLATPDVTLSIPGLGPCTDNPDRSLHLDSRQPVNVLVHGCFGSSGQFRSLAQVMAFHGQQSACFTYDDRARLAHSAEELRRALGQLGDQSGIPQITVIGHSQGALIARRAVTEEPITSQTMDRLNLRLVTISGPFGGIEAAQPCGEVWLYPLTLGLVPLSCYIGTGPKWLDITAYSEFIREPGALIKQLDSHLKIDTDERGSCRREESGRCVEDDEVFSLNEQRNPQVEAGMKVRRIVVNAGHVEIVGDRRVVPNKLIKILQDQDIIRMTSHARLTEFRRLLAQIYLNDGGQGLGRQDNAVVP